jgi:hypothetical protein
MLAIMFELKEKTGLARKHFAIAKIKRMREIGLLAPRVIKKGPREINFKIDMEDPKNKVTKD